jgi:hypothetical protein
VKIQRRCELVVLDLAMRPTQRFALRDLKEDRFEVFVHVDDDFVWIGSTDSMRAARDLIRVRVSASEEQFTIYSEMTHETTTVRATECRSPSQ